MFRVCLASRSGLSGRVAGGREVVGEAPPVRCLQALRQWLSELVGEGLLELRAQRFLDRVVSDAVVGLQAPAVSGVVVELCFLPLGFGEDPVFRPVAVGGVLGLWRA